MLDDFFLRGKVDTSRVDHCLDFAVRHNAQQVRLIPRPGPTGTVQGENIVGVCALGSRYRVCTQAAIWKKMALAGLLKAGESAWEFEHNATLRAQATDATGHFAVFRAALPYEGCFAHHVVEKGRWLPHERWIFSAKKIGCDFSKRGTLGWPDTVVCLAASQTVRFLSLFPRKPAERARRLLRAIFSRISAKRLDRLSGRNPNAQ
jgi:hypothetical protein